MILYNSNSELGQLDDWPFDNPASNYRILSGDPKASGRLDQGGTGQATRFGIWRCTAGRFECIEQGDELMTVLSGNCTIINHTLGQTVSLKAGDSLFIKDGSHVVWDVHKDVTKVFHGYKPDGY